MAIDVLTTRRSPSGKIDPLADVAWRSRGDGATVRSLYTRDQDLIWVTDFMSLEEQIDAYAGSLLYDASPANQNAIDYAVYKDELADSGGGPRVRMPGALMRIDRTIQVGYGIDFRAVVFEGEGMRSGGTNHKQASGTCLFQTFNDAPGINVQGGRNVVVRGFSMLGPNGLWLFNLIQGETMGVLNVANWIDPDFPASASSRYAPLAGIAIDAYSGPQPVVHYPDVDYPAFLGPVAQYNKGASSNTLIEDVMIDGYYVAIVQQPGDYDGNGDYTHINRAIVLRCAYAFSWGNSQSRVPTVENCAFDSVHTTFSTATFGKQIGQPGLACYSTAWSRCVQMFDIRTLSYGQGPSFYNCYAEAIYRIGTLGNAAETAGSVLFSGCDLGFSWWETYGVPVYILDNRCTSVVTFQSCFFGGFRNDTWGGFAFFGTDAGADGETARGFAFRECTMFHVAGPPSQRWAQCAYNATQGFSFNKAATTLEYYSFRAPNVFNLDTGANLSVSLFSHANIAPRNRCMPSYSERVKCSIRGDAGFPVSLPARFIEANGAGGVITQVGRNITFTFSGVDADFLSYSGGGVGDVIQSRATGATFWVYARTGDVISAQAQTGFDKNENLLTPLPNGDVFDTINCRVYSPSASADVLYADMVAGSPVLLNVVNGEGLAPTTIGSYVSVGDWFFPSYYVDSIVNPFGGNGRIQSIDNTAKTITVGGNFKQDLLHWRMGLMIRPEMANGTPA